MKWNDMAAILFLIPASVQDLRFGGMDVRWLLAGSVAAVVTAVTGIHMGERTILEVLFAEAPGTLLLALSIVTNRGIGVGDGICALILGLMLPSSDIYLLLMIALLFSSVYAAGLLVTHRGSRHSRMPWMPFMMAGLIVRILLREEI